MPIDKSPIRVGVTEETPEAVHPISNLPMYRLFRKFIGNREEENITVFYDEWQESGAARLDYVSNKKYIVKDTEDYPAFTGWHDYPITAEMEGMKLGGDVIIGQINKTLSALAFDVEDEYVTRP